MSPLRLDYKNTVTSLLGGLSPSLRSLGWEIQAGILWATLCAHVVRDQDLPTTVCVSLGADPPYLSLQLTFQLK